MQRGQLTYPVLADHRCLPLRLDDIDGEVLAQHRHVDRLAECAGQLVGQWSGLLGQFELDVDAASESYEPEAQAVFSALGILLDHLARLERTQQAKRRGLVHTDLAGDLADPAGAPTGQQFENLQGAVHRLETGAGVGIRYGHGVPSRILAGDASRAGGALVRGLGLSPATYRFAPRTRSEPSGSCHCLSQLPCRMVQRCVMTQTVARSATCCEGLITLFSRRKTWSAGASKPSRMCTLRAARTGSVCSRQGPGRVWSSCSRTYSLGTAGRDWSFPHG